MPLMVRAPLRVVLCACIQIEILSLIVTHFLQEHVQQKVESFPVAEGPSCSMAWSALEGSLTSSTALESSRQKSMTAHTLRMLGWCVKVGLHTSYSCRKYIVLIII